MTRRFAKKPSRAAAWAKVQSIVLTRVGNGETELTDELLDSLCTSYGAQRDAVRSMWNAAVHNRRGVG